MEDLKNNIKNLLEKNKINRKIEIEYDKIGNYTLKIENIYIHSKYSVEKEAERFFKINYEEKNDYFLIIGFGFGYHIEYFLKNIKKNQEIKVIILNPDIFYEYLKIVEQNKYIYDDRLEIIYGQEEEIIKKIADVLKKEKDGKIVINYPLLKSSKKYYPKIFDIIEKIDIDNKTVKADKNIISENIKKNIKYIETDIGVIEYKDLYKNKPVITVAAGPSLNKNVELLKKVKNKAVIIAVGTVLKLLLSKDIIPDFIVVTDGLQNIYNQFESYMDLKIPLLYIPGTNHNLISQYKGKRIIAFPDEDLFYEKMERSYKKGYISTGGSVATAAIDFAKIIGGNPIIFLGQDLALNEEMETHAEGTLLKTKKTNKNSLREIEGIDGKKVYTLKNLYHYLRWIEKYIQKNKEILYINATEGGANIKGTKIMKLEDVIMNFLDLD